MTRNILNSTVLAAIVAATMTFGTGIAQASDDDASCANAPRSEWRTPDDVKAAAEAQGYQVKSVKTEGSCFEVYAHDKSGRRTELYVDPVSLQILKVKDKS